MTIRSYVIGLRHQGLYLFLQHGQLMCLQTQCGFNQRAWEELQTLKADVTLYLRSELQSRLASLQTSLRNAIYMRDKLNQWESTYQHHTEWIADWSAEIQEIEDELSYHPEKTRPHGQV